MTKIITCEFAEESVVQEQELWTWCWVGDLYTSEGRPPLPSPAPAWLLCKRWRHPRGFRGHLLTWTWTVYAAARHLQSSMYINEWARDKKQDDTTKKEGNGGNLSWREWLNRDDVCPFTFPASTSTWLMNEKVVKLIEKKNSQKANIVYVAITCLFHIPSALNIDFCWLNKEQEQQNHEKRNCENEELAGGEENG